MAGGESDLIEITPALMLSAYAQGVFPMAASRFDTALHWYDPPLRGILPLDGFHTSHSLRRHLRRHDWHVTLNTDFDRVVTCCASRDDTWISDQLFTLYEALHRAGHAHSIEVWDHGRFAGGLFGLTLGGAFFGESMVSERANGSKAALLWAVDHLRRCGFTLLDTQFLTPHLASLGGVEIPRAEYHRRLKAALKIDADITRLPPSDFHGVLQRMTQMS